MAKQHFDAIEKVAGIEKGDKKSPKVARALSPEEQAEFERLMEDKKIPNKAVSAENKAEKTSLYDPTSQSNKAGGNPLSREDIIAQAEKISSRIEVVKEALAAEDAAIKPGYKTRLNNKLEHINENLRIALEKTGTEIDPDQQTAATSTILNPVQKFLGQMTHAQFQMETIRNYLASVDEDDTRLTPANMLAIQMKVNSVQEELELFTNMLNKALESTKTIMNVQV